MPSPVSGSVAPAASPTNSTRPRASSGARSMRAGIGQAEVPCLGLGVRRRAPRHVGPGEQLGPQRLHVAAPAAHRRAADPEADVGPPAGQRERPRVAGEQVGLEPHVQALGGRPGDVADVLAEGVPLAEVAGLGEAERLAHGATTCRRRRRRSRERTSPSPSTSTRTRSCSSGRDRTEPVAVVDLDPGRAGQVDERRVELDAAGRRRRTCPGPPAAGSATSRPSASAPTRRRPPASEGTVDGSRPRSSSRRSAPVVSPSPQHLSRGKRALSTIVTSRPARAQPDRRRGAGRAGADDEDLCVEHRPSRLGRGTTALRLHHAAVDPVRRARCRSLGGRHPCPLRLHHGLQLAVDDRVEARCRGRTCTTCPGGRRSSASSRSRRRASAANRATRRWWSRQVGCRARSGRRGTPDVRVREVIAAAVGCTEVKSPTRHTSWAKPWLPPVASATTGPASAPCRPSHTTP